MKLAFSVVGLGCMSWLAAACGPAGSVPSPTGGAGGAAGSGGAGGSAGQPGGGGSGGTGTAACTQVPSCPSGATVTGKVFAPNGTDPISGATVYVPVGGGEFPPGLSCDICNQGFASCTQVFSGPDGSFRLTGVPAGMQEIDIQKGRFRRKVPIDVACGENALTAEQTRLPKNASEGDLPRIAVANGEWDKLECVLTKIGLDPSAIDIYNHSDSFNENGKPDFGSLVGDLGHLSAYNIVFVNCSDNMLESYLGQPGVLRNLHDFVAMGGRLYITDWSYDHIEQVPEWSPYLCWQDGQSCPQTPEAMHGAAIGADGLEVDASIEDDGLRQWLGQLGATNPDGTVHLTHFLTEWVMQRSNTMPVKEWVKGQVRSQDGSVSGDLPLTVTFDYNACGRVLYSSYHTLGRDNDTCGSGGGGFCLSDADCPGGFCLFGVCVGGGGSSDCHFPDYCGGGGLSPQERILEYLIFEISTCIAPPG